MARLNSRLSVVSARSSRYASTTPAPASDQENRDPSEAPRNKGKGRAMDDDDARSADLPTPASNANGAASRSAQKRKRVPLTAQHDAPNDEEDDEEEEERRFNKYFDPNQNAEDRRDIKRQSRALERKFHETRDDLLRDNGHSLTETVKEANDIFKRVKQTTDATMDSRLLVNLSDLAYKKTAALTLGDASTGVDVDEFLSKCITYMRNGGPSAAGGPQASSSRNRQRRTEGDSDDEDDAAPLDWDFLGRHACFPYNSRPPVPSFLLGPLSVEKKQRARTQRARQRKEPAGRETRPEALTKDDLTQSEQNSLTAQCERIRNHLRKHIKTASVALQQAGITSPDDAASARGKALLRKNRLSIAAGRPGTSLFEYVVNPHSFGQTVENLFYVSFLIKEGGAGVGFDDDNLPVLHHTSPHTLEQQREKNISKHQAVFSLDYATWRALIDAFHIREPMIPHREEEPAAQIGSRSWYN